MDIATAKSASAIAAQIETLLDLLPFGGHASADNSQAALTRARATYQAALDALSAQLAGM